MRHHFICATVLLFVMASLPVSASSAWLLKAIPQTTDAKGGQVLTLSAPFQVILTNASSHDLTVWKEWCSWGYFNLSFEFKGKDGKVVVIRKNSMIWYGNFPDGFVVQPGCAYSITVRLLESNGLGKEWTGVEALQGPMTMTAIYQNTDAGLPPKTKAAWAGQVKSAPLPVTIVR